MPRLSRDTSRCDWLLLIMLLAGCGTSVTDADRSSFRQLSDAELAAKFATAGSDEAQHAAAVLTSLGAESVARVIGLQETFNTGLGAGLGPELQQVLVDLGAATAVPELARLAEATDAGRTPRFRVLAVRAMGTYGGDAAIAVDSLSRLLQDSEPEVRLAAAQTLIDIGPSARAAAPLLVKCLNEGEPALRGFSALALCLVAPEDPLIDDAVAAAATYMLRTNPHPTFAGNSSTPDLQRVLGEDPHWVRKMTDVLVALPRQPEVVVPLLVDALRYTWGAEAVGSLDFETIEKCCDAIASYGPQAASAVPVLERILAEVQQRMTEQFDPKTGAPRESPRLQSIQSHLNDALSKIR
jgi:hypothetical protein